MPNVSARSLYVVNVEEGDLEMYEYHTFYGYANNMRSKPSKKECVCVCTRVYTQEYRGTMLRNYRIPSVSRRCRSRSLRSRRTLRLCRHTYRHRTGNSPSPAAGGSAGRHQDRPRSRNILQIEQATPL